MSSRRKSLITSAFDRADGYDANARVQRVAADRLAEAIAGVAPDPRLAALEIGCGTGFLTERLAALSLNLTVTDIAPRMLDRVRARLGQEAGITYRLLDGEQPGSPPPGGWGLIASSLAFQWFEHPAEAIARLVATLAPGGWLAFTTLGPKSLSEWSTALAGAGLGGITRTYPDPAEICPPNALITRYTLVDDHADGLAFLRALRAIGAATSWNGTAAPTGLRRAIAAFEAGGARASYDIAQILIQRA